jgi:hypothetical protein
MTSLPGIAVCLRPGRGRRHLPLGQAREGDFDDPANPRRIRYLAERLAESAPTA